MVASRSARPQRPRLAAGLLVIVSVLTGLTAASPAALAAEPPATAASASSVVAAQSAQQAVDSGVANAAFRDVQQSVSVVDRATGKVLATRDGGQVFNSESILKLFTAAFYLVQADGAPDGDLVDTLRTMIEKSDDGIQTSLWRRSIVLTIADRYGLTDTRNAPNASSLNWGSGRITADDQARFLYAMSQDPIVGPFLMPWMSATAATGADGFNQDFGLNGMTGDHGSKQGWSDPGWEPYNVHSVGWTGQYFVAILQTSYSASSATMRTTATRTATLLTESMIAATQPAPAASAPALCDPDADRLLAMVFRHVLEVIESVLPGGGTVWCAAG